MPNLPRNIRRLTYFGLNDTEQTAIRRQRAVAISLIAFTVEAARAGGHCSVGKTVELAHARLCQWHALFPSVSKIRDSQAFLDATTDDFMDVELHTVVFEQAHARKRRKALREASRGNVAERSVCNMLF